MCWKKCYIYFFKFNENTFSHVSRVIYWQRCLDFHFKLKKIYHFLFACNDKSFNSCTIQYQYNGLRWRRATILINFYCIIVFRHQHKEIEAHTSFSQCFIDQRIQLFPSVISLHLLLIFLNNNNKWTKKKKYYSSLMFMVNIEGRCHGTMYYTSKHTRTFLWLHNTWKIFIFL